MDADPCALNLRHVGPIDTYDGWRGWADWAIDIVVEMVGTIEGWLTPGVLSASWSETHAPRSFARVRPPHVGIRLPAVH